MLKIFRTTIMAFLLALAFVGESHALMVESQTDKVVVAVVTKVDNINENMPFDVVVRFGIEKGWHIFSENPGDIGKPTKIEWKMPRGYLLKNEKWSIPTQFGDDVFVQNGYEETAYYKATIVPGHTSGGKADIKVEASWQVCNEECVPQSLGMHLSFDKTAGIPKDYAGWNDVDLAAEKSFVASDEGVYALPIILIMAFAGGLILNFMPCIFPILTLKAINLVQGRYNHREMKVESILYLAGVVFSFLLIASILVFFRSQGENIGWGFQLQSPVFVCIILVLFFVIFLMLLDVVTMRNPFSNVGRVSKNKKRINSFATGFFAVLIASPCTAPFMGIAIGYTLTQPIYVYYPVFLALSLGYALPFSMVGFFPRLLHKVLPKPGKWMLTLKRIFAVPVFLTCVWLVWVLQSQVSILKTETTDLVKWEKYDTKVVRNALADGKPVFIDFTAKWCITCLTNEKFVLHTKSFAKMVEKKGIRVFKADWTNEDPEIARALAIYGRNSIPLYVLYDGKSDKYVTLPQILTPKQVEKVFDEI